MEPIMETSELVTEMEDFLNDQGQWTAFMEFCKKKGFKESQVEKAFEDAKQ